MPDATTLRHLERDVISHRVRCQRDHRWTRRPTSACCDGRCRLGPPRRPAGREPEEREQRVRREGRPVGETERAGLSARHPRRQGRAEAGRARRAARLDVGGDGYRSGTLPLTSLAMHGRTPWIRWRGSCWRSRRRRWPRRSCISWIGADAPGWWRPRAMTGSWRRRSDSSSRMRSSPRRRCSAGGKGRVWCSRSTRASR